MSPKSAGTDPLRDQGRLSWVRSLDLLDTPREEAFDCFTRLAARFLNVPIALFTLVDEDRQFFKSEVGLPEPWAGKRETPLSHSFCQHVVASGEPLVIGDAREDPLLRDNLAIPDLGVVAYAGIPLTTPEGETIGSFCAIDNKPHEWTEEEIEVLRDLASGLMTEVRLRQDISRRKMAEALLAAEKRVLEAISTGASLAEVLNTLTHSIHEQVPQMRCSILLVDERDNRLRLAAAVHLPPDLTSVLDGAEIREGMGTSPAAVLRREPVVAADVKTSPITRDIAPLLEEHGLRAATSVPIISSGGEVLGAFAAYYDETRGPGAHEMEILSRASRMAMIAIERDQAERELHGREMHYRRLVETSPMGIYALDLTGRCTEINHAFAQVLGRSVEDLVGRHFSDVIAPEDLQQVAQAFQEKVFGEVENTTLECRMVRPSGEHRRVQLYATVIRDEEVIIGTHGLARDITEEREREGWMRLFTAALETLHEGVSVVDAQGRFLYSNAAHCRVLGYEPGGAPADGVAHFLPDEEARAELERIIVHVREHGAWTGQVRRRRMDGTIIPIELIVQRVQQDKRELFFTILRDITEELEREGRLRRAERLASVGTLISGVAHELNNPLHVIRGFTEMLLLEEQSQEQQEDLKTIQREVERMAKIVSDLRLVARESQQEESLRTRVDLNDVVRHVLRTRQYTLPAHNIDVRQDLAPTLPPVWGHRGQLEQVVLNLVVNAEQAMSGQEREKRIIVRTRASGQGASLQVVDTGHGISQENMGRIFDPFWSTKVPGEGTGLGLSLVHGIVSEHRGEIRVDSQVGEGTAFRIDLPRAPLETATGERSRDTQRRSQALRILIVDDEAANRGVIARYLRRRGHEAAEAAEGGEALRLIEEDAYDVIVSDLRMPGLSGGQLLDRLREQGRGMERRLIYLTGDTASEDARRVLERANVPVFLKPVSLPDLTAAVEAHAERVREER